ncbi:transcriptional regulator [Ensifer sp. Root31]|uniref:MarR family winged helix-turn-helix transcriptional regulator n=1 Tax=Ensifer sp. Root31 TaxID=1736512 RepID=UPI00070CE2DC|nr:MarR family transcriptional regulator [Ensifer sp. Root31]KQU86384.1 transcriptional regulator [Ensifer sp. Root31]
MTELYDLPGHLIRRLHQISVSIFANLMSEAGIDLTPVQFAALVKVRDNPGIDQATLAGLIAYDRATIGGVVDRLVAKGLLQRDVSSKDRRARVLIPTDEGERILASAMPIIHSVQDELLTGLNDKERSQFENLLRKAIAAMNDASRAPLRFKSIDIE